MGGWRITTWWGKLLYVGGYFVAVRIIEWPFEVLHATEPATSILTFALAMAGLLVGARIFRGKGEPVAPPRPWWQLTARARLSWRLGFLLTVVFVVYVIQIVVSIVAPNRIFFAPTVWVALTYGAAAYLYLNSAVRLRRGVKPRESEVEQSTLT